MFIMWGSKLREKELGSAEFNCPQCRGNEEYAHVSLSRWFTLYLLPLYEIESIGEFVKCLRCKQLYPMEILSGLEAYPAGFVPVPRSTDTAAKVVVIVHGDSLGPRLIRLKPLERELSLLPGEKLEVLAFGRSSPPWFRVVESENATSIHIDGAFGEVKVFRNGERVTRFDDDEIEAVERNLPAVQDERIRRLDDGRD
jgi:hypothetical protein